MKRDSYRPGLWWCAIAVFIDFALTVFIAVDHWGHWLLPLMFIASGVAYSFSSTFVLSNKVREWILEREVDHQNTEQIDPLRLVSTLAFHGLFFALGAIAMALVWIDRLLALQR